MAQLACRLTSGPLSAALPAQFVLQPAPLALLQDAPERLPRQLHNGLVVGLVAHARAMQGRRRDHGPARVAEVQRSRVARLVAARLAARREDVHEVAQRLTRVDLEDAV